MKTITYDPSKWQLVPVEPIFEAKPGSMSWAGAEVLPSAEEIFGQAGKIACNVYRAMLKVAPAPEDVKPADGGEPVAWQCRDKIGWLTPWLIKELAEEQAQHCIEIRPLYAHPDRTNEMLLAALKDFKSSLELAKGIFAHYADLHSSKFTPDGDAKAQANLQHANSIARIIKKHNETIEQAEAGR